MNQQQADNRLAKKIYDILNSYRKNPYQLKYESKTILATLQETIKRNKPLLLILPAFHGKSRNKKSVIGNLPDAGEILGLQTLTQLCESIKKIWAPGAILYLLHEGHFYTDPAAPMFEDDQSVENFLIMLGNYFPQEGYIHSMGARYFFPEANSYDECRKMFFSKYLPSLSEAEELIKSNEYYRNVYLGYKNAYRLEYRDILFPHHVRKITDKKSKQYALEHFRRYIGFGKLVKAHFKKELYIKLSLIYKSPEIEDQITINLIKNNHKFGTPGFFTLVRYHDGTLDLMKKEKAIAEGFQLDYFKGLPYYKQNDANGNQQYKQTKAYATNKPSASNAAI